MLIMPIDHLREMLHLGHPNPIDLQTTTAVLFFTRWITHFCAPAFVLLSGVSAYLAGKRRTKEELAGFLIKRGIWLIIVEICVISLATGLDLFYHEIVLQVIWAIGGSMILLGLLVTDNHRACDTGVFCFVWLLLVTVMYFPCRWFSNYKKTHGQWWLSYL